MTISYGVAEYVDVIVITDNDEIWLVTPGFADRLTQHFVKPGEYTIRLRIISPHGAGLSVPAAPIITWNGNRKLSAVTWRQAAA